MRSIGYYEILPVKPRDRNALASDKELQQPVIGRFLIRHNGQYRLLELVQERVLVQLSERFSELGSMVRFR